METIKEQFRTLINREMQKQGISKYRISKDTNISASLLSSILSKEQSFSLKTAQILIDYLNIKIKIQAN